MNLILYIIAIVISESWINDNNAFIYNIPNYNAYVSNRKHKHAGGVLFYIRKQFSVKIIDIFTNNYFQSIILEIDDKICICLIYRAPSLDFNSFYSLNNYITTHFNNINKKPFYM